MGDLIEYYGGASKLAAALGVTTGAVSQWCAAGEVPAGRAIQIERITEGRFKAVDLVGSEGRKDDK